VSLWEGRPIQFKPRVHALVAISVLQLLTGCALSIPEATLSGGDGDGEGSLDRSTERLAAATGLRFRSDPVRAWAGPDQILEVQRNSVVQGPIDRALEEGCYGMFRPGATAAAPAALGAQATAYGRWSSPVAYDPDTGRILMVEGGQWDGRRIDLARTEALALALLDQQVDLDRRLKKLEGKADRAQGLVGTVAGAAHAATLEASIAPVLTFDASALPIRRLHRRLTERLLEDPDGAPAELLVEPDLPSAERRALQRLLETEGLERRRAILRTFAGARLLLEAKDLLTSGNLPLVFEDLPVSTEQLLHPEKYLANDDPPLSIKVGSRDGLAGRGFALLVSGTVGEFGLRHALEGALPLSDAAGAASGWGGDHLTIYRERDSEDRAYAWHLEFDDRFEASEAADAFLRALVLRLGGSFEPSAEGGLVLKGGRKPAALRRERASLAVLIGGREEAQTRSLVRLLAEPLEPAGDPVQGGSQDLGYRLIRAVASPLLHDAPGRFHHELRSLYGMLFRHRTYPSGAEHTFLNLGALPFLGRFIPDELNSLLFGVERSPARNDNDFLVHLVRLFRNEAAGSWRFWSPFFSYSKGPEFWSIGSFYGFLYEQASGAGREAFSPRLLWSRETGLSGAEQETGVLLDAVTWRKRDGLDRRLRLLPFGALMSLTLGEEVSGLELGFVLNSIRIRSRSVIEGAGHFEFALLYGWLARALDDDASDHYEYSIGKGLLFGAEGGARFDSAGLFRIFGRSFLGFGQQDERGYFDALYLRFGG